MKTKANRGWKFCGGCGCNYRGTPTGYDGLPSGYCHGCTSKLSVAQGWTRNGFTR